MRKLVTAACLLFLFSAACAPAARAQAAKDSYARAHMEVFGRPPVASEAKYWRTQTMTYGRMVDLLKEWLRKPEGAKELAETIERSYMNSLGRAPSTHDLAYWQAEVRAKHYGYTHVVDYTRRWLKSPGLTHERKGLTERAYGTAFGRPPAEKELAYWDAVILKEGTTYSELVEKCVDWMLGSSLGQVEELKGTIDRAHVAVKRPTPEGARMKYWITEVGAKRLTYQLLVILIPKAKV